MNTSELQAALVKRHPPEAWALCFEVGDATGGGHTRWADAVAMSLWPSRGLHLHGFEIKASRSDWVKELKRVSSLWIKQRDPDSAAFASFEWQGRKIATDRFGGILEPHPR